MPFKITITEDADRQLRSLPVRDQRILEAAILSRLHDQPTMPTKAIKRLRPDYELRAGNLRVLYNVNESEVVLLIVGRKEGNKLVLCRLILMSSISSSLTLSPFSYSLTHNSACTFNPDVVVVPLISCTTVS